jgi:16S rRNA (guanine966-N2)-methyltransferase
MGKLFWIGDDRMRIISGKFRGRRLKGPTGLELRPTSDRMKESLFNIIGPQIVGATMLDVFGGTGAIGIEALSRGARDVVFIENADFAQKLIRQNLKLCGIDGGGRIVHQDVFGAMRALIRQNFKADFAYFDPPYDFEPYQDLLDLAFKRGLLAQEGRGIIEHHRKALIPEAGEGFARSRVVRQGDHCLSFFQSAMQ